MDDRDDELRRDADDEREAHEERLAREDRLDDHSPVNRFQELAATTRQTLRDFGFSDEDIDRIMRGASAASGDGLLRSLEAENRRRQATCRHPIEARVAGGGVAPQTCGACGASLSHGSAIAGGSGLVFPVTGPDGLTGYLQMMPPPKPPFDPFDPLANARAAAKLYREQRPPLMPWRPPDSEQTIGDVADRAREMGLSVTSGERSPGAELGLSDHGRPAGPPAEPVVVGSLEDFEEKYGPLPTLADYVPQLDLLTPPRSRWQRVVAWWKRTWGLDD